MSDTLVYDSALRLFADLATPAVINAAEAGTWPESLWDAVTAGGFLDVLDGGGDGVPGGVEDAVAVLRAAGRHAAPIPLPETMLARWLARRADLVLPEGPLALVVETPEESFELGRDGRSLRLAGTAAAVPWARQARAIVVSTREATAVLIPALTDISPGANLAGEPRDGVRFDMILQPAAVAAAPARAGAATAFRLGALFRAAQMAGALEAALELAVTYANDRVQFGRPIGKFQAIQQQLALAAEQVAASGVAVAAAASAVAEGDIEFAAAAAKLRVGEAAGKVCDIVHQVHGAIGFTHEHRLHHFTRRLWSWRDEFGVESQWAHDLGRLMVAEGPDGLWPFLAAR
ncbi:MAG TPA: acyl-CoA dehydrogenase family protein [Stellaceae bacterium]|nr:acyl-CoA dehydrogenase family protein [Stellaceae bacterium]